jgi:hypothetical protein
MTPYEIPLSPQPQTFTIALVGVLYRMSTRWCGAMDAWVLDIYGQDELPLVLGIPLVTGTDLLGQYKHLGIGGSIVVQTLGNVEKVPGFADLGTSGLVFFITES